MANDKITKVKAYLCEDSYAKFKEIRFLAITDISYSVLEQKIKSLFPDLNNQTFNITWIDEDGDIITVSSHEELQQALLFLSNGTFKVYIKVSGHKTTPLVKLTQAQPIQTPPSQTTEESLLQEAHPNIVCDGCNGKVVGSRFKCLICDDYDLCQSCLNKNTHYDHDMIRMVAPTKISATRNWFKPMQHIWHKMARHSASIEKREEKIKAMMEHAKVKHCRRMQRKCGRKFDHSESATDGEKDQCPEFMRDNPFLLDFQPFVGFRERADKQSLLKNIGASVANLLDPLGINVTIDVENSDGEIEPCATCPAKNDSETDKPKEKTESTEEANIAEDIFIQTEAFLKQYQDLQENSGSDKTREGSPEQTSLRNILSNIRDMSGNLFQHMQSLQPEERKEFLVERMTEVQGIMCEVLNGFCPQNVQPEEKKDEKKENEKPKEAETEGVIADVSKPAAENVEKVEVAAASATVEESLRDTGAIPKRPSYPESSKPSEDMMEFPENDWTLLNKEASPAKETVPIVEVAKAVSTDTVTSSSPKLYPELTMDDDKYRQALLQMIHMGYSNEGQWLSALIKAKNGDIAAVLEVLHPTSA